MWLWLILVVFGVFVVMTLVRKTIPEDPRIYVQEGLVALEKGDIDLAVRHARGVKPHGMGGITDWWPSAIHENETPEYNALVLPSLINEWIRMMSFSFDELDRAQRDLQVGELEAKKKPDGQVLCPFCRKIFSTTSATSWDGSRHVTCGVRLRFVSVKKFQT